jgi:hypothetical protein
MMNSKLQQQQICGQGRLHHLLHLMTLVIGLSVMNLKSMKQQHQQGT